MHSDSNTQYKRKQVIVSDLQAQQLIKKLQRFQQSFKQMQKSFDQSSDQIYFIISTTFLHQWRQYCQSSSNTRFQPIQMNCDIYSQNKLKPNLIQKQNFQLVNQQIYKLFQPLTDKTQMNRRQAYRLNDSNQKRIPIYLKEYKYLYLNYQILVEIDKKTKKIQDFKFKNIELAKDVTLKSVMNNLRQKHRISDYDETRLYVNQKQLTRERLYELIKKELAPLSYDKYKIKGAGKKLENLDIKAQDILIDQEQYLIFQSANHDKFILINDDQDKCQGCYKYFKLQIVCGCQKVKYCSIACQSKDQYFHRRYCNYAEQQQLKKPVDMTIKPNSRNGLVGLKNLGNTCFMNSCLQCLSNTAPLTKYFLNKFFEAQINLVNPIGSKGKLAKNYANFIKGMWCDQQSVFSPHNVKSAVSKINPIFGDYSQHDSQQFFSFLVDGLHQDLNRIQKKPYVQSVQQKDKNQKQLARQSWIAHLKRNQSIIMDLMTGQYRSIVTCPDCNHKSTTFDPFITVTLPIPEKNQNIADFFLIHKNMQKKTQRSWLKYTNKNADQWNKKANQIFGTDPKRCILYLTTLKQNIYRVGRDSMAQIVHKIQNQNKNLFLVQFSQQQFSIPLQQSLQFTTRISTTSYHYHSQQQFFKLPMIFDKRITKGLSIFIRYLKFLYSQAYTDVKSKKTFGWGGKSYQTFQEEMLKNRVFKVILRYGKKVSQVYTRKEVEFTKEVQIKDDDDVWEIMQKEGIDINDCELDARFERNKTSDFNFSKLKDFQTVGKQPRKHQKQDIQVQIDQCFKSFQSPQILQAGNQWYCPKCKDHKLAKKQLSIYRSPKILIIQLKRFKQKGLIRKQKNNSLVHFPHQLDLNPYVIDKSSMQSYKQQIPQSQQIYLKPKDQRLPLINPNINKNSKPIYSLYAISNHFGGLGGGHYTAYAKNQNQWYQFDDSSVGRVKKSEVCSSGAYLLFYERIE